MRQVWTYTYQQNFLDHQGPAASVTVRVYAVDCFGQVSEPAIVPLTNPVPSTPSAPTAGGSFEGFTASIDPPTDTDINYYEWDIQEDSGGGYAPVAGSPFKRDLSYTYKGILGYSYKARVRMVDWFYQTGAYSPLSGPITLAQIGPGDITDDVWQLVVTDEDGNSESTLAALYDYVVDSGGVAYTVSSGSKWIEYEWPVQHVISQLMTWLNGAANAYFALSEDGDTWEWYGAEADHTGAGTYDDILVLKASEAAADTDYLALSSGRNRYILPLQKRIKAARVFLKSSVTVYEIKWHVIVTGHELRGEEVISLNYAANAGSLINLNDGTLKLGGSSTPNFEWDGTTQYLGLQAAEHIEVTATDLQIKYGATTYTKLAAAVLTLGDEGNEHAIIDTSGLTIKDGTTTLANYGATVTVGRTGSQEANVHINADKDLQIRLSGAVIFEVSHTAVVTVGEVGGGEYLTVQSAGIEMYGGGTKYVTLTSGGVLTLGDSGNEHVIVNTSGVTVKDVGVTLAHFGATVTVGEVDTSKSNVYITSGAVQLRTNTTVYAELSTTGILTLGYVSGGEYVTVSSTGISMYGGGNKHVALTSAGLFWAGDSTTTERLQWDTSSGLQIFNHANAAVIQFDTSGNAKIINSLRVGDASSYILIDGTNALINSSNFSSGVSGWQINYEGDAEFANATIRGELHCAVFVKDLIEAQAGTLLITKSAGKLHQDMAVPGSGTWSMYITDPPGGGFLFDNSDRCRCKGEYASGIADIWFTVTSRTDMGDGRQRYTCTHNSGTKSITYPAGIPVVDYGVSGDGFILQTADLDNAPYIVIATHAGSPWTTTTTKARFGELEGSYGYTGTAFGVAMGEYGAGKINLAIDDSSGIRIRNNTTVVGQWDTSGNITIGEVATSKSNVYITAGAVQLRTNEVVYAELTTAGLLILGDDAGGEYVTVATTGIEMYGGDTKYVTLTSGGVLTLGDSNNEHVIVNTSGVTVKDVGVTIAHFGATVTIGEVDTSKSNVYITSGALQLRTNQVVHIDLQADGDVFIGEDTSAAATTNIAIFTTEQSYNGETVYPGDMIIGDSTTSMANIFWDKSAGKLNFRAGTGTPQACIDTTGALTAGGGVVTLDSDGIIVEVTTTYAQARSYQFKDTTDTHMGGLSGWRSAAAFHRVQVEAVSIASEDSYLRLRSEAPSTGQVAQCELRAFRGATGTGIIVKYSPTEDYTDLLGHLHVNYGLRVGTYGDSLACYEDDIVADGGIYLGRAADPGDGNVAYAGVLKSYKNAAEYTLYPLHYLTTLLTSTSWTGSTHSTTAKTLMDTIQDDFTNLPANIKAVLFEVAIRDSGSSGTDCFIVLSPNSTAGEGPGKVDCHTVDNRLSRGTVLVPCTSGGDMYYQIAASDTSSMDVWLKIAAYAL